MFVHVNQCESLARENEHLKERVEELSVDLQIIKEEIATAGTAAARPPPLHTLSFFCFTILIALDGSMV